jgi:peptide-methionine (S)-S-oxide reductase
MEKATFAAGCFWGVEGAFRKVEGVESTHVGYTGGHVDDPSYEDVCSDTTGHTEAVQIEYDPSRISYEQLLEIFWNIHDPTTPDRQGPEEVAALASKQKLEGSGHFSHSIVTEIAPASEFYPAEDYHQCYYERRELDR